MPIPSGASLVADVRAILHDNGIGFSSSDPYYIDSEIIDSLKTSRQMLVRMLLMSPQTPYIALAPLSKTVAAADNTAVPADFYKLICGYTNAGQYVPAKSILTGEAMKNSIAQQIYVRGGKFFGTADNAYYWAMPSQAIANNGTLLTELSPGAYDAIKYQACLYLLMKEEADAKDRYVQITTEVKRKLSSLA